MTIFYLSCEFRILFGEKVFDPSVALSENVTKLSVSILLLRKKPTKPNEANKPEREREKEQDAKSMVQLENMSQKTNNREFTQEPMQWLASVTM